MRSTRYREPLLDVLRSAEGPLTAVDIRDALSETGIGMATVYRHLRNGIQGGEIVCIEFPDGPKRYEPADLPQHHHFECVQCRRVFDLPGSPSGIDRLLPDGWELDHYDVFLTGRCRDCPT